MPPRRNELTSMVRQEPMAYRASFDASGNTEYEGWAPIGAADTDGSWTICKHTYTSGNLTSTSWALTASFDAVWDDRASYFS